MTGGKAAAMYADCARFVSFKLCTPEEAEIVHDGPPAPA
jgi:hypothetical protein